MQFINSKNGQNIITGKASRLNVFISYSRQDLAFVDRLQKALAALDIQAFVDRDHIEKGEEWWTRIKQLIGDADSIVFVLSPNSVASKVCKDEAEYAHQLNKRFVPIVARDLAGQTAPAELSNLNYIFFCSTTTEGPDAFELALLDLVRALETDITWIREHTRLGVLAGRWVLRNRSADLLLRGVELTTAEAWLDSRPSKAPDPTDAHRALISESRRNATRRKRTIASVGISLVVFVTAIATLAATGRLEPSKIKVQANRLLDLSFPSLLTSEKEMALKPGDNFQECASCPQMIVLPTGIFSMGSDESNDEKPRREVPIAYPLAVGRFEISYYEWDGCRAHGGCPTDDGAGAQFGRGSQPVINVTWDDAQVYVKWLSGFTGQQYRLLSEAEWEYAARAGTTGRFGFDDPTDRLEAYAWFNENSNSRAHEVGKKTPNRYGLYDMLGNVSEWVQDCYDKNGYMTAPRDGAAAPDSEYCYRVLRGGSWSADKDHLTVSFRDQTGNRRLSFQGFRVARSLPQLTQALSKRQP